MESESPPRIFFALGNPGRRYERTRHNFGRLVLKRLLERWKLKLRRAAGPWSEARFDLAGTPVILVEPSTYMNRVGPAAVALLERHNLRPDALVALYDDVDIPFGFLRLRKHGGAAGHRGMLSLIGALGTEEFARLRLGIGGMSIAGEVADFVLEEFSSEERPTADTVSARAADALECVAARGLDTAMNLFNSAPPLGGDDD